MKYLGSIGLWLFILGLCLAITFHSTIWYTFFLTGGFLMLEGVNRSYGFSILKNKKKFLFTWFVFVLLTLLTELIGNFLLNGWDYHYSVGDYIFHVILIGYPFTAFFGLEFFAFTKRYIPKKMRWLSLSIAAIVFGYINELPNVFAYEWKYNHMIFGNFLGIPILVSFLWLLILLVLLFEKQFYIGEEK